MYVVCVTIYVKGPFVPQFIEATLDNARGTRCEPGNVRFDVLQVDGEPERFMLYEAYKTKDGFLQHQQTAHYLRWREAVADWMAQPRQGIKHQSLFFDNAETPGSAV